MKKRRKRPVHEMMRPFLRSNIFVTMVIQLDLFHLESSSSDLFTSTLHMQESISTEVLALEDSRLFVLLQEHRLNRATAHHETILADILSCSAAHSVLGKFLSVSRLASFGTGLPFFKEDTYLSGLRAALSSPSSLRWWETYSDVYGAAVGICKLQQLYNIPATKMAAMRSRLLPPASARDLKDVARGCSMKGPFGNTSAWSSAALEIASIPHSCASQKLRLGLGWLQINDERWSLLRRSKTYKRPLSYPTPTESDVYRYKSVCIEQGELRPSGGRLFCAMSTNYGDPRLILQPNRIEVLSLRPRIVIFPGFLTSKEVKYIRAIAQKGFQRAEIYMPSNVAGAPSWNRIGKVPWLWDDQHPILQRLTRRIATALNLSLESAEPYQVANYGLGGHYTPHQDAHQFDKIADSLDLQDGNRLATVLIYLADVEAGGATAFVNLGIGVKPRVGDALFWYDVEPYEGSEAPQYFSFWHQKRKADPLTEHAGCPILSGSKWIVTKWIHERNNVVVLYNTPG